jgi:hypothetical protein
MVAGPGADWMDAQATASAGVATIVRDRFSWYGAFVCAIGPNTPEDGCVTRFLTAAPSAVPTAALVRPTTTESYWRMVQAGTLQVTARYKVRSRCINAVAALRRLGVRADGTIAAVETLVEQGAPLSPGDVTAPGRSAIGSVVLSTPIDRTSNGRWRYVVGLTCTREGRTSSMGESFALEVDIPAAPATFSIGGTVSGLAGSGLVLQNNAGDDLAVASNGAFTFPTEVAAGGAYVVTVRTQPGNPVQNCTVQNGAGNAQAAVTNVAITCVTPPPPSGPRSWRAPQKLDTDSLPTAAELRIGYDAAGNAVAAWIERGEDPATLQNAGEVWSRRWTSAAGWSAATRVARVNGLLEDLNLAVLANGAAIATWTQTGPQARDVLTSRFEPGTGWSTPALLETLNVGANDVQLAMLPSGVGFAMWLQDTGPAATPNLWVARHTPSGGWSTPVTLETTADTPLSPRIAVSANGDAIAVWSDGLRAARYTTASGWSAPETIPGTEAGEGQIAIAMDDVGRAAVVYITDSGLFGDVRGVRYANGWGAEERLRTDGSYLGRLKIVMRGTGEAVATWMEGEGVTDIWTRPYGTASGTDSGFDVDSGGVRTALAFDPDGTVLLVYRDGAGSRVRAIRSGVNGARPWSALVDLVVDVEPGEDYAVATDSTGNAIALWSEVSAPRQTDVSAAVYR